VSLAQAHLEDLPASARELAEIIGLPAALRLVEGWGGWSFLYVPKAPGPEHALSRALGHQAALALAAAYGGDYIRSIPRCADAMRLARDRRLLGRRAEGASPAGLALEFGLTERHVWRILAEARVTGPEQGRLLKF